MANPRPILVVEIDLPLCSLTYGTAPCTAAVGVTGAAKCFNTSRTCQDKANYTRGVFTLRFCEPFPDLTFDAYPALGSVNITPNVINPGRDMGTRAEVSISIDDFQSADVGGLDKYLADRAYIPFDQGTFWGKFRARIPSMEGFPCRVRRGDVSQDIADYSTEHYIVTSAVMDAAGISIKAKDFLALCDTKKAQAPSISNGRILAALNIGGTTSTLTPAGIGDLEYPAAGRICLSGKEVISFTRSGNVLTWTDRGASTNPTVPIDHKADAIAQLVLEFDAVGADDIIRTLLEDFTPGFDTAWIDDDAWQAEVDTYVGVLYTGMVTAPTAVNVLINELIFTAGLALWVDVEAKAVRLISLRPVVPDANLYDDDLYDAGSLAVREQPDKRVSQAWTYYGLGDPTNKLDKESNFQAGIATVGTETTLDYDLPSIAKTFSRWIPVTARNAAERLNNMLLARFQDAPRGIQFSMFPTVAQLPKMGTGIRVAASLFQDPAGARTNLPFFVTSVERTPERVEITAEEAQFFSGSVPGDERTIFIEVDTFEVNLWDLYNSLYSGVPDDMILHVYITGNAYVGARFGGYTAFYIPDDFPADATIILEVQPGGGIEGAGGGGGNFGGAGPAAGGNGGNALHVERPVIVRNYGIIGGGAGGGGRVVGFGVGSFGFAAAGGGGGAGFNSVELVNGVRTRLGGYGGANGGGRGLTPNSIAAGAYGGEGAHVTIPGGYLNAGDGGSFLGVPGETGYAPQGYGAGIPGNPGKATVGESFITWEFEGNVYGART